MICCFSFGCNSDKNHDWKFKTDSDKKNNGFVFTKEDYSSKKTNNTDVLNKSSKHQGCSAPCCSEGK